MPTDANTEAVIDYLASNPRATAAEIARALNITPLTATRTLKEAQSRGDVAGEVDHARGAGRPPRVWWLT